MIEAGQMSVVVTAYNIEGYIEACLASIVASGGADCPILVVDDGSKDKTLAKVEAIARQHPNVRFVTKENGGASTARNLALRTVETEYLTFFDGDDLAAEGGVRYLLESILPDADMSFSNRQLLFEKDNSIQQRNSFVDQSATSLPALKGLWTNLAVHGKVYRRRFLLDNDIFFPEGMMCEDIVFSHLCYLKAKTASSSAKTTYVWRKRHGGPKSVTQSPLSPFTIKSRIRQIDLTFEIRNRAEWKKKFGIGPSCHEEFGKRMIAHVNGIISSNNISAALNAFSLIREGCIRYRNWINQHLSATESLKYNMIFDGDFDGLRALRSKPKVTMTPPDMD